MSENLPFTTKYLLKLVVSNGIQEAYATLFDAAEDIIGCSVNRSAESLQKVRYNWNSVCLTFYCFHCYVYDVRNIHWIFSSSKQEETFDHYKTLVMCEEYKFLVRMDAKKREEKREHLKDWSLKKSKRLREMQMKKQAIQPRNLNEIIDIFFYLGRHVIILFSCS